jgi:DNA-binding GntR family transcriptional regulator
MRKTDMVYEQLKQDVFQAKYKPNIFITEQQIADKYGVSKLTAGDALHRLCAEGHLTSYPRSGYMVTNLTPQEAESLKRLRVTVESLVIEIICEEAAKDAIRTLYKDIIDEFEDDCSATDISFRFHMNMARLTNDRLLIKIVESTLGTALRLEQSISTDAIENWQDYHKAIVDALMERDAATAKAHLVSDINQR